jgi:hypothetical protein
VHSDWTQKNIVIIFSQSNTFSKIQEQTDTIWKFQRYALVYEYVHKPFPGPPFIVIPLLLSIVRVLLRSIIKQLTNRNYKIDVFDNSQRGTLFAHIMAQSKPGLSAPNSLRFFFETEYLNKVCILNKKTGQKLSPVELQPILRWEKYIMDDYVDELNVKSKEASEFKIQNTLEK